MRIVVLVKEVPDTYGDRRLDLETGLADRTASDAVLDEIGERALEVALAHADGHPDTEVVLLAMGPASASATVRKGLAMGAARAVQVVDEGLAGADLGLTAETIAAALRRTGFDLVIAGNQSTDGSGGVLPVMLAELLDASSATGLATVELTPQAVSGEREADGGGMRITAPLPAIISVTERLPEARFPTFKGIMAAKRKPIDIVGLADLGVDPDDPGAGRSIVVAVAERPPRATGVLIVDQGDGGAQLADYLIAHRLA